MSSISRPPKSGSDPLNRGETTLGCAEPVRRDAMAWGASGYGRESVTASNPSKIDYERLEQLRQNRAQSLGRARTFRSSTATMGQVGASIGALGAGTVGLLFVSFAYKVLFIELFTHPPAAAPNGLMHAIKHTGGHLGPSAVNDLARGAAFVASLGVAIFCFAKAGEMTQRAVMVSPQGRAPNKWAL